MSTTYWIALPMVPASARTCAYGFCPTGVTGYSPLHKGLQTKVFTFLSRSDLESRAQEALNPAKFIVQSAHSAQQCPQRPRSGQYEDILVYSDSLDFADDVHLVKLLRQDSSCVALFVLARYLDLGQRSVI